MLPHTSVVRQLYAVISPGLECCCIYQTKTVLLHGHAEGVTATTANDKKKKHEFQSTVSFMITQMDSNAASHVCNGAALPS
jgi:hypothetical protein